MINSKGDSDCQSTANKVPYCYVIGTFNITKHIFFLLQSDVEEGSNYISGHTEKLNENSFIDTIIINHIFVTLLNIIY